MLAPDDRLRRLPGVPLRIHPDAHLNQVLVTGAPRDVARVREVIAALDPKQNQMAKIGTTHLVPIMNDFDLLPTHNFKFGRHPLAGLIGKDVYKDIFDPGFDGCWLGCTVACSHGVKDFVPLTGDYAGQKVYVDGPEYETIAGCGSNLGCFDPYFIVEMNLLQVLLRK